MTQVVKLLQDARNLISKPENWTQDDFAKMQAVAASTLKATKRSAGAAWVRLPR